MAYVTSTKIKEEAPNYDLDLSSYTDSEIEEIIAEKEELINRICGQRFDAWQETIYLDGGGETHLHIPMTYPIQSISKVEVKSSDNPEVWTELPSYAYDILPYKDGNWIMGYEFSQGNRNVRITGLFGSYISVPPSIKRALIILVMDWFDIIINGADEIQSAKDMGATAITQGKYSVSFAQGREIGKEFTTGNKKVDALLSGFLSSGGDIGIS